MERLTRLVRLLERAVFAVALLRFFRFARRVGPAGVLKSVLSVALKGAKAVPGVGQALDAELAKERTKLEQKMLGDGDPDANMALPEKGQSSHQVFEIAERLRRGDDFGSGKTWAGIYHDVTEGSDSELEELQNKVFSAFNSSNNLYPGIFKSTRKFEAELVQMAVTLLNGGPEACGLLTSGGTESILLALLSYRELARERGIEEPEVICASSAHGALDKACFYFGLTLVKTEADPKTLTLTAKQVEGLLTRNTIAVYASAPSFPHGTVDPIAEIAALCEPRGVGVHVDNCLGGFYLSFLARAGRFTRDWDFKVSGVTTISMDVHKYGFAPKGASVVCFKNGHLRRLTVHPVTTGLTLYVTPTLQGSRGGGVVAAAWATVMHIGAKGYEDLALRYDDVKSKIERFVETECPDLTLPVRSDLSIVPIGSDKIDIYAVASLMEERGWSSFTSQNPPLMQICIGEQHFRVIDDWLNDLKECAEQVKANPGLKLEGDAAVYGAAKLLPEEVLGDIMRTYIEVKMTVKPLK